jgi:hypothetical protein
MTAKHTAQAARIARAASHDLLEWHAIDWRRVHQNVRRLQARIVKAIQVTPLVGRVYRPRSHGGLERLEPDIGKLICPVLRGGVDGNAAPLLDTMRLTVLQQTAKGLPDQTRGARTKRVKS